MEAAGDMGGGGQQSAEDTATAAGMVAGAAIGSMVGWMGAAAASGNLRIDPEAGAQMKRALHNLQMDLETFLFDSGDLARELPLGSSVQAELLKPWQTTVVEGPPQAYMSRIGEFRDQLDKLVDSIDVAVRKFQENDEDTTNFFAQGLGGEG